MKAADQRPHLGRLSHHLATIAKPSTLDQLSLYLRPMISTISYRDAKASILTCLTLVLEAKQDVAPQSTSFETTFIKVITMMFKDFMFNGEQMDRFEKTLNECKMALVYYIHRIESNFKSKAIQLVLCIAAALYQFGESRPTNIMLSLAELAQHMPED